MNHPDRFAVTLLPRLLLLLTLLVSAAACQDPVPAEKAASAEKQGSANAGQQAKRPFCRLIEAKEEARLDVLVATYRRGDATLTLYGLSLIHI